MSFKEEWISFTTLSSREISRILRVWKQTVVPPVITALLYILIFGYSLGSRINEVSGVSYLEFIFPGLVMMAIINTAYANSSFSLFIAKFQKSIQEYLVAPLSYVSIIAALFVGSLFRAFLVAIGIFVVGIFVAGITVHSWLFLVLMLTLSSAVFSLAGILTALWAKSFDQVNVFTVFIITPLTYLGGVFYAVEMLPPMWQGVSRFNPIYYLVDGFRYAFLGHAENPLFVSVGLTTIVLLLFGGICFKLFKQGYNLRT